MLLTSEMLKQYCNNLLSKNIEILHSDLAIKQLELNHSLVVYCGYEVSGKPHIGTILTFLPLVYFSIFDNVKVYCLFADLHTPLNQKQNKTFTLYSTFLKIFPKTRINYITGFSNELSGFQKYITLFYENITKLTLKKVIKSTEFSLRNQFIDLPFAKLIYPILQYTDISFLKINLAIGGMDLWIFLKKNPYASQ